MAYDAEADGGGLEAREEEEQHIGYNQLQLILGIEHGQGEVIIGYFKQYKLVYIVQLSELPALRRTHPITKSQISSTTKICSTVA